MIIRPVQLADAAAIRAIYQPYVTETAITFEDDVPTVPEFERRITKTLAQYPYLVAEEELQARGYLRFLACIAVPNEASIAMHEKRGYVQVAHFPRIGYKFGQWHDIVWMQKTIDGPVNTLKEVEEKR